MKYCRASSANTSPFALLLGSPTRSEDETEAHNKLSKIPGIGLKLINRFIRKMLENLNACTEGLPQRDIRYTSSNTAKWDSTSLWHQCCSNSFTMHQVQYRKTTSKDLSEHAHLDLEL